MGDKLIYYSKSKSCLLVLGAKAPRRQVVDGKSSTAIRHLATLPLYRDNLPESKDANNVLVVWLDTCGNNDPCLPPCHHDSLPIAIVTIVCLVVLSCLLIYRPLGINRFPRVLCSIGDCLVIKGLALYGFRRRRRDGEAGASSQCWLFVLRRQGDVLR